jgi:hypothetical protein
VVSCAWQKIRGPTLVTSGVKQGCILPPVIFLMIMDILMRKATEGRRDTNWDISEQLENLDFTDDVCLLSHALVNMEKMVRDLQSERSIGRLLINFEGTKSLKINTRNKRRFKMNENYTEKVNSVHTRAVWWPKMVGQRRCKKIQIRKANAPFIQLYRVSSGICCYRVENF